jgi:WD40 repeat protein
VAKDSDSRRDALLQVWCSKSGRRIGYLVGDAPLSMKLHTRASDGRTFIASGAMDGPLRIYDGDTLEALHVLPQTGSTATVWAMHETPGGHVRVIASQGSSGLQQVDCESGEVVHTWDGFDEGVNALTLFPPGDDRPQKAAVAESARRVTIIDLEAGTRERVLGGHTQFVYRVAAYEDNDSGRVYVVSASYDQTAKVFNAESGRELHTLAGVHTAGIGAVAVYKEPGEGRDRIVLGGGEDGTLSVWDAQEGRMLHRMVHHEQGGWSNQVQDLAIYYSAAGEPRVASVGGATVKVSARIVTYSLLGLFLLSS